MKRSTFSILFYLNRSKIKKNGCCPIMGRITVDGGVASFSTGHETAPGEWSAEKGRVTVRAANAKEINRELDQIRERLQRHYERLVERDGYITAERLKNELTARATDNTGLLAEARAVRDEVIRGIGITHVRATCAGYENSYKNLCDYVNGYLGLEDISLMALDYSFVENFDFFLKIHKKHREGTANIHMIFLRKVLRLAVRKRMIRHDLFDGYRYVKSPSTRKYLNQKELHAIMTSQVYSQNMNKVRHLFIFSALTGLSKADIFRLKTSNIHVNASGGREIRIERIKTGTECIVPLGRIPLKIIDLYARQGVGDLLFPLRNKGEINYTLKQIAREAGLNINLTFHQARHTFSTLCLSKGMGIETLSRILGHQSIRTTQTYAKITNSKIAGDMKNVALLLEGKEGKYATNDVVKPVRRASGM